MLVSPCKLHIRHYGGGGYAETHYLEPGKAPVICLKEKISPDAVVERFGYFFPNVREHGNRLSWTARDLADGSRVLECLCGMLAGGCFPFSDDPDDVRYSDYTDAFCVPAEAAETVRSKIENGDNTALQLLRELRTENASREESTTLPASEVP